MCLCGRLPLFQCACLHAYSCGSGLSGEALTEAGHAWVGVDISQAMLGKEGVRCEGGGGEV